MARTASDLSAIRPLRRTEHDRLVEEGAFANERIELLDGKPITREPQSPHQSRRSVGSKATLSLRSFPDVRIKPGDDFGS